MHTKICYYNIICDINNRNTLYKYINYEISLCSFYYDETNAFILFTIIILNLSYTYRLTTRPPKMYLLQYFSTGIKNIILELSFCNVLKNYSPLQDSIHVVIYQTLLFTC